MAMMITYKKIPYNKKYYVCEVKGCGKKADYYDSGLKFVTLGFSKKTWIEVSKKNNLMFVCEAHKNGKENT